MAKNRSSRNGAPPYRMNADETCHPSKYITRHSRTKAISHERLHSLHNEIQTETLYRRKLGASKSAKIFERINKGISLGTIPGSRNINTEVNTKMMLLTFLAINYSIPVIVEVITWFEECIVQNYANPQIEQHIMISQDTRSKQTLLAMMNEMRLGITGYRFD